MHDEDLAIEKIISETLEKCKEQGILLDFLNEHREEVEDIMRRQLRGEIPME